MKYIDFNIYTLEDESEIDNEFINVLISDCLKKGYVYIELSPKFCLSYKLEYLGASTKLEPDLLSELLKKFNVDHPIPKIIFEDNAEAFIDLSGLKKLESEGSRFYKLTLPDDEIKKYIMEN